MKNIVVAIFAILFSTNILSADPNYPSSEKDAELCTAVATTFDGIDTELLEMCIYDAQMIRIAHQCPETVDTVSCLQTSCNAKPPVETFTKETLDCLTKHLSAENKKLMQFTFDFVKALTGPLDDKRDIVEENSQWIENEINSALDDALKDID